MCYHAKPSDVMLSYISKIIFSSTPNTFLNWMVDPGSQSSCNLLYLTYIISFLSFFFQFMCACIYFMLVSTHIQVGMWRTEVNVGTFILLLFVF